jgi:hypothetical protein
MIEGEIPDSRSACPEQIRDQEMHTDITDQEFQDSNVDDEADQVNGKVHAYAVQYGTGVSVVPGPPLIERKGYEHGCENRDDRRHEQMRTDDLVKEEEQTLIDCQADESDDKEFLEPLCEDPRPSRRLWPTVDRKHWRRQLRSSSAGDQLPGCRETDLQRFLLTPRYDTTQKVVARPSIGVFRFGMAPAL